MSLAKDLLANREEFTVSEPTETLIELNKSRDLIDNVYKNWSNDNDLMLFREKHIKYLRSFLVHDPKLPENATSLRIWCIYYILHGLDLLDVSLDTETYAKMINFISLCQNNDGGFSGGPNQLSHLASTYAGVMACCIVGKRYSPSYSLIDRENLFKFIQSCKNEDGSFKMGPDQESDMRAVYCALAVCRVTNIFKAELFENTGEYIKLCQNYDGGFGAKPGLESHGGYCFCAYASLILLNKEHLINRDRFLHYVVFRQMSMEGGFQGRSGKLVDSCYSYWVGSLIRLVQAFIDIYTEKTPTFVCDSKANQLYLLLCAQCETGGFSSRIDTQPDLYHTCYSLSGLSLAQHTLFEEENYHEVLGDPKNLLADCHPIYNITFTAYNDATSYFQSLSDEFFN